MRTRNRCYRFWGYNGVGCSGRVEVPKRQFVLIKLSLLPRPFHSKFQKQFMLMFSFSIFPFLFLPLWFSLFSLFLYKTHTHRQMCTCIYIYIYTFACMKLLFSALYPLWLYKYYTRSLYTYFYLLPRLHERSILKKLWFHPLSTYHGKTSTQI